MLVIVTVGPPSPILPSPNPPVTVIVHDIWYTKEWSVEDDLPGQSPLAVLDKKHVKSIAKTLEAHKPFSEGLYRVPLVHRNFLPIELEFSILRLIGRNPYNYHK